MRKALLSCGTFVLLCGATVAYPHPGAKSDWAKGPAPAAPTIARVRILTEDIPDVAPAATDTRVHILPVVDQPDIAEGDRLFLDGVLRALPALCRESLEHIIVRYDPKAERGQATATTMLLRGPLHSLPAPQRMEMIGVITHECGHIISLKALNGEKRDGVSPYPDSHLPTYNGPAAEFYAISWKNAEIVREEARDEDFVSGYAKQNPFEDIAETIAYFVLQEQSFRERAESNTVIAKKLAWAERYIRDADFTPPPSAEWNGKVPWDVTKLPHTLAF